jgi:hypothetical protein
MGKNLMKSLLVAVFSIFVLSVPVTSFANEEGGHEQKGEKPLC